MQSAPQVGAAPRAAGGLRALRQDPQRGVPRCARVVPEVRAIPVTDGLGALAIQAKAERRKRESGDIQSMKIWLRTIKSKNISLGPCMRGFTCLMDGSI